MLELTIGGLVVVAILGCLVLIIAVSKHDKEKNWKEDATMHKFRAFKMMTKMQLASTNDPKFRRLENQISFNIMRRMFR